jgi:hypothetical protein
MTYAEDLHILPFFPTTQRGHGIVAPLIRVTTHLADVLSDLINNREWTPDDEAAGMDQLRAHASGIITDSRTISQITNDRLLLLQNFISRYSIEFHEWSRERPDHHQSEAVRNTQELLNRIANTAAQLDVELAAIPADAGRDV